MSAGIKVKLSNGIIQPISPVTLKNTIQTETNRRIDQLLDVVADTANTVAGSTLVYDPSIDKYVVQVLDLDGGSF